MFREPRLEPSLEPRLEPRLELRLEPRLELRLAPRLEPRFKVSYENLTPPLLCRKTKRKRGCEGCLMTFLRD